MTTGSALSDMHIVLSVAIEAICDWACKNQPCEHKKSPFFLSLHYHNLQAIYTNTIKPLLLLQNLMGYLLKFKEMEYHIHS